MSLLPITLTTAAASGLLAFWLGARTGRVRMAQGISVGDGGHEPLTRRMRAQANFVEYTPFVLILVAALEMGVGSKMWLWLIASLYVVGRVLHMFGMDGGRFAIGRRIGTLVTLGVLLGLSVLAAWLAKSGTLPF